MELVIWDLVGVLANVIATFVDQIIIIVHYLRIIDDLYAKIKPI